jgi:hypothetical protein
MSTLTFICCPCVQVVNSCNRLKEAGFPLPRAYMEMFWEYALTSVHTFGPQELSMTMSAFASSEEKPPGEFWKRATKRVPDLLSTYDAQGLAMIMNSLSKVLDDYRPPDEFFRMMEAPLRAAFKHSRTQELANMINGYSKIDNYDVSINFLQDYVAEVEGRVEKDQWQPLEVSVVMNGLAKLRPPTYQPSRGFLAAAMRRSIAILDRFNPQETAMLLNSLTKMDFDAPRQLFERAEQAILRNLKEYRPQELSNVVHAFGKLGFGSAELLEAVQIHAQPMTGEFKSLELANLVNGLSKMCTSLGYSAYRPFLEACEATAQGSFESMNSQELTIVPHGLMKMGHRLSAQSWDRITRRAGVILNQFKDQELAVLLYCYGRTGSGDFYPGNDLMGPMERMIHSRLNYFTEQGLIMVLNGMARLGYGPSEDFLRDVDTVLTGHMNRRTLVGANLGQALNSLSNLSFTPSRAFLAAFKTLMLEHAPYCDLSCISIVLWSMAALDVPNIKVFITKMLDVACRRMEGEEARSSSDPGYVGFLPGDSISLDATEAPETIVTRQLVQVLGYLDTLKNPIEPKLFERFSTLVRARWAAQRADRMIASSSSFHLQVLEVLEKELGLECESEVKDEAYTLDIVIRPPDGGLPVVMEVDGPYHFYKNRDSEPMGFTVFKHRMLTFRADRWRALISLPHHEWYGKTGNARRDLLIAKLAIAGVDVGLGSGAETARSPPSRSAKRRTPVKILEERPVPTAPDTEAKEGPQGAFVRKRGPRRKQPEKDDS